jgi:TetR/AcrR family transcriptional repressor of mexJK operon
VADLLAAPRSGRPKDTAKREAIVTAARTLFARQPYDLVTMEAVAAQASVSKMTVYSHFHDKETLFETIVIETSNLMLSALADPKCGDGLRDQLVAVGTSFLSVILGTDICKMGHSLPGALRANPDLKDRFYAAGPGRVRAAISGMIARAHACGELTVDDPDLAADDLVSLWEGNLAAKIAFGLADLATPTEISRRAVRGTEVFLRAYRPAA